MMIRILLILALSLFASACSTLNQDVKDVTRHYRHSDEKQQALMDDEALLLESEASRVVNMEKKHIFYFDFDSDQLHPSVRNVLEKQATYLIENPDKRIQLRGHTDERGSAEYNIALGWRRAQSVGRFLREKGVSKKQLSLISFGAQRPDVLGHDEAVWRKNRRVVLHYLGH